MTVSTIARYENTRVRRGEETPWIDAWIRWERDSKDVVVDETEDSLDDDSSLPPPTETFFISYPLSPFFTQQQQEEENDDETKEMIHLEIQGFPSDSEQIWNSTGLTLWPSSHYLCEYMLESFHEGTLLPTTTSTSQTKLAVELGSGLGHCGLLLHHLLQTTRSHQVYSKAGDNNNNDSLAYHIFLTDGDTDALKQLRENVEENILVENKQKQSPDGCNNEISCHQLLWGQQGTQTFCHHHLMPLRNEGDNNKDDMTKSLSTLGDYQKIQLLFGSDLIYVQNVIEPLFETVRALLDPKDGKFLMAHSNRRHGNEVTLEMVLEHAQKAGFDYEIVKRITEDEIYVMEFSRVVEKGNNEEK